MRFYRAVLLFAALGVALVPAATLAAPLSGDGYPVATLTVIGYGQLSRPPDLATVAVTITTNDNSASRALSENNRRFSVLEVKLAAIGIAASDVTSTSIGSYFNPRPAAAPANVANQIFGYVVTRNAQIAVNAISAAGGVVDAATAAGATQINGVSYGFRDRRALERAALALAVNDAYAQAQAIAGAAHLQIVRVLRIGDDGAVVPGRVQPLAMMSRVEQGTVPTTIAPSDLDVSSSISVTYAIR